jgi:hypothetical protein
VSVLYTGVDIDFPTAPLEGIVEQITRHFVEILFLARGDKVARNIDADLNLFVGVDLSEHGAEIVDARRQHGTSPCGAVQRGCACTAKMVADAPIHEINEFLHFGAAFVFRKRDREGRQRRFQAVGQIGHMTARSFKIPRILLQKTVELRHQRLHFSGLNADHAIAASGPYFGNGAAQPLERLQAQSNLQQHGEHERDAEHEKRNRQSGHCLPKRTQDCRTRRGRDNCYRHAGEGRAQNSEMEPLLVRPDVIGRSGP